MGHAWLKANHMGGCCPCRYRSLVVQSTENALIRVVSRRGQPAFGTADDIAEAVGAARALGGHVEG